MPENPKERSKDGHENSRESKPCVQKKAEVDRSWLKEGFSRVLQEMREYFDAKKYGRLLDFVVQKYQLPKNPLTTRQEVILFMTRLRQMKFTFSEASNGWPAASLNLDFISRNSAMLMLFLIDKKSEVTKFLKTPAGKGIDEKKVRSVFADIIGDLRAILVGGEYWRTVRYDYLDSRMFDEHDLVRNLPYKYGANRYMAQFLKKDEGAEKIWSDYHRAGMFNDFFLLFIDKKVPVHITKQYVAAIKPRDFLIYAYSYLSGEMAEKLLKIAKIRQKTQRDELIKKLAGKYSPKTKIVPAAPAPYQGSKTGNESIKEKPRMKLPPGHPGFFGDPKPYEGYRPAFDDQKTFLRFVRYVDSLKSLYGRNWTEKILPTLKDFNSIFGKNKISLIELPIIFACWSLELSSQDLASYLSISPRFGIKKINFALGKKDFWDNIGSVNNIKHFLRRSKDPAYRLWLERNKNRIRGLSLWQLTNVNHYNPAARLKPEQQAELLNLLRIYPNFRKFNLFNLYLEKGDKRLFPLIPFLNNEQEFVQACKILEKGLSPKEVIAGMKAFSFDEIMYIKNTRFRLFDFLTLYNGLKARYPYLRTTENLEGVKYLHYCLVFGLSSKVIADHNNRDLRYLTDINVDGIMRILKQKDILPQKIKNFCETYNLNFFQRYNPELLHNMLDRDFDRPDRREKPIILVFTTKADYNSAFDRRLDYRKLYDRANFIFFDMNSINDPQKFGVEWAKENLRGRKIAHIFYQGHGSRENILLSEKGSMSITRQNANKLACLLPFLAKKGQIVLRACSTAETGKTGNAEQRLASVSRAIARRSYPGHSVFAARGEAYDEEIEINKEGGLSVSFRYKHDGSLFKAVEWRCEGKTCRRIE